MQLVSLETRLDGGDCGLVSASHELFFVRHVDDNPMSENKRCQMSMGVWFHRGKRASALTYTCIHTRTRTHSGTGKSPNSKYSLVETELTPELLRSPSLVKHVYLPKGSGILRVDTENNIF